MLNHFIFPYPYFKFICSLRIIKLLLSSIYLTSEPIPYLKDMQTDECDTQNFIFYILKPIVLVKTKEHLHL